MKKKTLTLGLFLTLTASVFAQKAEEMKTVWETKLNYEYDLTGLDENLKIIHGSNEKNFGVVNAGDGSKKWVSKFSEISENIKKVDLQIPMYESKAIFLFDKKMGKDFMVVVDIETGKMLWSTSKYQGIEDQDEIVYIPEMDAYAVVTKDALTMVKARTGEELWSTKTMNTPVGRYIYDDAEKTITMVNMPRTFLGAMLKGFKNQILKINVKNGDVIWEQTYRGFIEKKVVTREVVAKFVLAEGNKLMLQLNGLQVFDYKTGKPLWSATYDVTFEEFARVKTPGRVKAKGVYGAVADPLYDGEFVYILDFKSKSSQYLKKYEANSGKLVWTSPEIKDARAIPGLFIVDGVLLLQVGGAVEVQGITVQTTSNSTGTTTTTYKSISYQNVRPYNVQAFNVSDGKQIWESDRFKKGISNMILNGKDLIVCSGKALYNVDYKTGKEKYEVSLDKDDISLAEKIINPESLGENVNKDNVIIVGSKGVSAHNMKTGEKVWANRTKNGDFNGIYGTTAFYQTESDDQFAIDVNSGKATYYNARKNAKAEYSSDGNYLYAFEKKVITKLSTK
ncbi:MAG: PQQ-binding-like beta-propeller repeat protein [Bacteroidales bacterium]